MKKRIAKMDSEQRQRWGAMLDEAQELEAIALKMDKEARKKKEIEKVEKMRVVLSYGHPAISIWAAGVTWYNAMLVSAIKRMGAMDTKKEGLS